MNEKDGSAIDGEQLTDEERELLLQFRQQRAAEAKRLEIWQSVFDELNKVYDEDGTAYASDAVARRFIHRAEQCGITSDSDDLDLETFAQALIEALGLQPIKERRSGWRWERTLVAPI